jgi:hypothetical protein
VTVIAQGYGPGGSGALLIGQGYSLMVVTTFPPGGAPVAGAVYPAGAAAGSVYAAGCVAGEVG